MNDPAADAVWARAKRDTPSRAPYTDEELKELRIWFSPNHRSTPSVEAVAIWTLLDTIEAQKGWTV